MVFLEYYTSDRQKHWLAQMQKSDWVAGRYLARRLEDGSFKEEAGATALVLMLVDEQTDSLVSYCTLSPLDSIRPTSLSPWIGFVYTFPRYRGHRYAGTLMRYAESLATIMGRQAVYLTTTNIGLYEKYGYTFYQRARDSEGQDTRIYRKELQLPSPETEQRKADGDRWKAELVAAAKRGVDMTAVCGLSCRHCFLGDWCGGCRSVFCCCSYGTLYPGDWCPNVTCAEQRGLDGCYCCGELENCTKGFYGPDNDGAAAIKAQAMFIRKYGKEAFFRLQDRLHARYHFQKIQELLGQDPQEGLLFLEKEG